MVESLDIFRAPSLNSRPLTAEELIRREEEQEYDIFRAPSLPKTDLMSRMLAGPAPTGAASDTSMLKFAGGVLEGLGKMAVEFPIAGVIATAGAAHRVASTGDWGEFEEAFSSTWESAREAKILGLDLTLASQTEGGKALTDKMGEYFHAAQTKFDEIGQATTDAFVAMGMPAEPAAFLGAQVTTELNAAMLLAPIVGGKIASRVRKSTAERLKAEKDKLLAQEARNRASVENQNYPPKPDQIGEKPGVVREDPRFQVGPLRQAPVGREAQKARTVFLQEMRRQYPDLKMTTASDIWDAVQIDVQLAREGRWKGVRDNTIDWDLTGAKKIIKQGDQLVAKGHGAGGRRLELVDDTIANVKSNRGLDFTKELLPWSMFETLHNKLRSTGLPKNPRSVMGDFVKYVKAFDPDMTGWVKSFDDAMQAATDISLYRTIARMDQETRVQALERRYSEKYAQDNPAQSWESPILEAARTRPSPLSLLGPKPKGRLGAPTEVEASALDPGPMRRKPRPKGYANWQHLVLATLDHLPREGLKRLSEPLKVDQPQAPLGGTQFARPGLSPGAPVSTVPRPNISSLSVTKGVLKGELAREVDPYWDNFLGSTKLERIYTDLIKRGDKGKKVIGNRLSKKAEKQAEKVKKHTPEEEISLDNQDHRWMGRVLADNIVNKSASQLWRRNDLSFLQKIQQKILNHDDPWKANEAGELAYWEGRDMALGDYKSYVDKALFEIAPQWFRGLRPKMPEAYKDLVYKRLVGIIKEPLENPKLEEIYKAIKEVQDHVYYEYIPNSGLGPKAIEYVQNFQTRIMKEDMFRGRKQKQRIEDFENMLRKNGWDESDIMGLVENMIRNRGAVTVKHAIPSVTDIHEIINSPKARAKKAQSIDYRRKLYGIPEEDLMPFLETDPLKLFDRYIESTVARVEYAKRFGWENEILHDLVAKAAQEAQAKGKPLSAHDAQHIYKVTEAIQGVYGVNRVAPSMSKGVNTWRTGSRNSITLMNWSALQLSMITSLAELALPLGRAGLQAYAEAMPIAVLSMAKWVGSNIYKDIAKLPKFRAEEITMSIHKAQEAAALERINAMWAGDFSTLNNMVFKANGLEYWTRFMHYLGAATYDRWMLREIKNVAKSGKEPDLRMKEFFAHYGIKWQDAVKWLEETGGDFSKAHAFKDQYRTGALRFSEEVVLTPNPARLPLWHSNPDLAIFKHLKTFPILFSNTVMKQFYYDVLRSNKGNPFGGEQTMFGGGLKTAKNGTNLTAMIFTSIAIAHLSNSLKDYIRYEGGDNPLYERYFADDNILVRGGEKIGMDSAHVAKVARAVDTAGWAGIGASLFDVHVTGGFSGGFLTLLGPEVSKLFRATNAGLSGNPRAIARELVKLIAGNASSRWHDQMTDEVTDWLVAMGMEETDPPGSRRERKERN